MPPLISLLLLGTLPAFAVEPLPGFNVLMVGWDGTRLERLLELRKAGKLPNLEKLIRKGSFVGVRIPYSKPDTKAGWSEILSGYDASVNRVQNNKTYAPIPKGLTLFERLKERFGPELRTVLVTGKTNNLGVRGFHKICVNCITRLEGNFAKSKWWDESTTAPTFNNQPRELREREGEPYFNARSSIDHYTNQLQAAPNVLKEAKKAFAAIQGKSFFAFIHFEEPDEQGHQFGESSKQYSSAIETADRHLGLLLRELERKGMAKSLRVFVMGDHGFDIKGSGRKGDREHGTDAARSTFFAADQPGLRAEGDRRDFTPTILKLYGFDIEKIEPKLQGKAYF